VRSTSNVLTFLFVVALSAFALVSVWPDDPDRYFPGDFWPSGNGIDLPGLERESMRLGLDLRGGSRLVLEADPPEDYEGDLDDALDTAKEVIERRVNAFGLAEAEITKASGNRLQVAVPGISLTEAQNLIGRTAQLEFRVINDQNQVVPATGILDGQTVAMTGQHLKSNTRPAQSGTDTLVEFETTGDGAELLKQITGNALRYSETDPRRLLLIYLDDQEISSAVVQAVIEDSGVITGQESFTAARNLSRQLNAGALPVPLTTVQSQEVSASLGENSVIDSVHAGIVGLMAVAIFMILYYRLPGFLATAALGVYTLCTLLVFKVLEVTLTTAGIAAFVLSIGIAVDANILIFERMKEELRRGRPLSNAIDIGFHRAWSSIRDSNVSTLITCVILYWFGDQFGATVIKGFAVTLAIGVVVSMFSAITVTRTFLRMVLGTPLAKNHWLFNAEEQKRSAPESAEGAVTSRPTLLDFSGKRWWYIGFSMIFVVIAAVALAFPPRLVPSIEFTSGSSFTLQFTEQQPSTEDVRDAMADLGHEEAKVQGTSSSEFIIRTDELQGAPPIGADNDVIGPVEPQSSELDQIEAGLEERFGPATRLDFSTVSGTVSREIAVYSAVAVGFASLAIMAYIWWAFRHLPKPLLYGGAAVFALLHDSFVILGLFSILGKMFGTEVDTAFITALLTVIGFSVHDTIVVYDRIREKLIQDPYIPFEEAVNASLTETLARSIITSLMVFLTVVSMLIIGGETIRDFVLVLLVGTILGTYSSIGIAAQLVVAWESDDFGRFWRRIRGKREPVRDEDGIIPGEAVPV
jgi:protein-export membrane protein SecD/preprotein translocase SecF subunit